MSIGSDIQLLVILPGATALTRIAAVLDQDGPSPQREHPEASTRDGRWRLYESGYADPGQVTLPILWDRSLGRALQAQLYAPQPEPLRWRLVYQDGVTHQDFAAYVAEEGLAAPYADNLIDTITLRVTGTVEGRHPDTPVPVAPDRTLRWRGRPLAWQGRYLRWRPS